MKPKAPKKKDPKPNCKTGEVRHLKESELDWKDFRNEYHIYPIEILNQQLELIKSITFFYKNRKD
jgi:hypothetical protein